MSGEKTQHSQEFDACLRSEGIPEGTFGDYAAYVGRFQGADTSESNVLGTMQEIQQQVGDITFLGGQTVRPMLMGPRQMRDESFDIDTVLNTPAALENLAGFARKTGSEIFFMPSFGGLFLVKNGLPVSIHLGNIYGVDVDPAQHAMTFQGVQILKPEMLASLKLRRKTRDGRARGKDIVDIAALICSHDKGKVQLDANRQADIAQGIGSTSIRQHANRLIAVGQLAPHEVLIVKKFLELE